MCKQIQTNDKKSYSLLLKCSK